MTETRTQFERLLDAMEMAGQKENPWQYGYGEKRRAVLEYVVALEAELERVRGIGRQLLDAHFRAPHD